jgi:hypothetical protein
MAQQAVAVPQFKAKMLRAMAVVMEEMVFTLVYPDLMLHIPEAVAAVVLQLVSVARVAELLGWQILMKMLLLLMLILVAAVAAMDIFTKDREVAVVLVLLLYVILNHTLKPLQRQVRLT